MYILTLLLQQQRFNHPFRPHVIKYMIVAMHNIEARAHLIRILQAVITGRQGREDKKRRRRSFVGDTKGGINETVAVASKKQQDDIRNALLKCALFKDNQPRSFVELQRTFHVLLRQNRNKELEKSVPLMFHLQELCTQENSVLDKPLSRSVQTLVASYFTLLTHAYKGNSDLESYVQQVIAKRVESQQISPMFPDVIERFIESVEKGDRNDDIDSEMESLFTYVIVNEFSMARIPDILTHTCIPPSMQI